MLYISWRSLCCQIFCQVSDGIAFDSHHTGVVQSTGGSVGKYACGVIHKVRGKGRVLDLGIFQIPGKLMDNGTDHFQVPQFFCTDIRQQTFQFTGRYNPQKDSASR